MTDRKRCSRSDCQNPLEDENGLLPLTEFYKLKKSKDGLRYSCKHCNRRYRASDTGKAVARKYKISEKGVIANRRYKNSPKGIASEARYIKSEKGRATIRKNARRYAETEEGKASNRRKDRKYKSSNNGKATIKRYKNSEERKASNKRYKSIPKGKVTERRYNQSYSGKQMSKRRDAARRTRKTKAGGSFSKAEWEALCAKYDYKCLACHQKKPLEPDHIKPVARGGTSNIDNIQPLCRNCNAHKGIKIIDYR
jgi:5-methylcytosine-specific restriction endonuclease McrA